MTKLEGTWEMELKGTDLHFEFETTEADHEGKMTSSYTISKSDLSGFSTGQNITFSLIKPGGEIKMTGDVESNKGEGTFIYTPNESYIKSLADAGYKGL